jgi:hypothetical protein
MATTEQRQRGALGPELRLEAGHIGSADWLEMQGHGTTAALPQTGAQDVAQLGDLGLTGQQQACMRDGLVFEMPPPMVPCSPCVNTTMRVPGPRGTDPWVAKTVTTTPGSWASCCNDNSIQFTSLIHFCARRFTAVSVGDTIGR